MAKTGRPADWLREHCVNITKDSKLIEFLAKVASGEPLQHKVKYSTTGHVIERTIESADIKDRIKAVETILDRGFGKSVQQITADVKVEDSYDWEKRREDLLESLKDYLK